MAKPSVNLMVKDSVGAVSAYVVVQIVQRVVKPDPEAWWDELAIAAIPITAAILAPPKFSRQAAAAGGASMYPLLTRLAMQLGIL